ncbi:MAG: hypothetical protein JRN68_01890 [Nitrososphaerota archaeon]|jgi:hypothetical protein|nr:hypothetical protein [Nitrososphaerota archaeon]
MRIQLFAIPASVVIAYTAVILTSYAWLGVVVSLPLLFLRPWKSFMAGLLIGLVSSFSMYVIYPASSLIAMSDVLGGVAGLPPILALSIYPVMFSLITAFSASMWSELYAKYTHRDTKPGPVVANP